MYYIDDLQETAEEYTILVYCENVPGVTSNVNSVNRSLSLSAIAFNLSAIRAFPSIIKILIF